MLAISEEWSKVQTPAPRSSFSSRTCWDMLLRIPGENSGKLMGRDRPIERLANFKSKGQSKKTRALPLLIVFFHSENGNT
jgi:hypothetical protein